MTPERTIKRLAIGVIGPPPPPLMRDIAQQMSRVLPIPCTLLADPLPIEATRMHGRDQIDADRLLAAVEELETERGTAICGLTADDIGHPLFTHFFGRARRGGRAMIVSLARLTPAFYGLPADDDLLVRRACLEILHELGHLADLLHCEDYRCIMRFAPTVEAIDTRGDWFCENCVDRFRARLTAAHRPA